MEANNKPEMPPDEDYSEYEVVDAHYTFKELNRRKLRVQYKAQAIDHKDEFWFENLCIVVIGNEKYFEETVRKNGISNGAIIGKALTKLSSGQKLNLTRKEYTDDLLRKYFETGKPATLLLKKTNSA